MLGDDVVDQFVRHLIGAVDEDLDLRGHKRLVRKLAQMDMARRVHRDHRRHFWHRIIFAEQRRPEHRRAVELAVLEQSIDIFVARDAERLERGQPGHRIVAAQLRVKGIGFLFHDGIERIIDPLSAARVIAPIEEGLAHKSLRIAGRRRAPSSFSLSASLWAARAAPKGQPCHEKAEGAKELAPLARSASP